MSLYIKKHSGEQELFDIKKFERSLRRSGANRQEIDYLAAQIVKLPEIKTTQDIYRFAYEYLRTHNQALAVRYNLKNALYELGPEGFYFERLVAKIFLAEHYKVQLDQIVQGTCVAHEIDLILTNASHRYMVECKFHNAPGIKCNVKTPLYIKARYDDVKSARSQTFDQAFLITNTQFTSEAIAYGECAGLKLLGWAYPEHGNIAQLIDKHSLHPLTSLASLTKAQKKQLIQHNALLCKDLTEHLLHQVGLSNEQLEHVMHECSSLKDKVP